MLPLNNIFCTILIFCSLFISTCSHPFFAGQSFPYNINEPDRTYILKKRLNEVSGINMVDSYKAALIDDEIGTLFYYDLISEKVSRQVKFSKGGDWEDLLIKGDTAYILKSDGTLLELDNTVAGNENALLHTYNTELDKINDAEGICYDDINNRILIACKGKPYLVGSRDKYRGMKSVYAFNPVTKKLDPKPVLLIDVSKIDGMMVGMQMNIIRRVMNLYNMRTKDTFQPAGISIQPFTRDVYIISSVGNVLIVLNPEGKIIKATKLSAKIFKQPEGITFDKEGNLYITNEGKSGKGNILKFSYNKNAYPGYEF